MSSVRQHEEDGLENAWIFFLDPDGDDDIAFSLATGRPCDSGGIRTEDGTTLSRGVQVTLPGPEEAEDFSTSDAVEPQPPLTASFASAPATHDGSSEFTFDIEFSEEVKLSYVTLR